MKYRPSSAGVGPATMFEPLESRLLLSATFGPQQVITTAADVPYSVYAADLDNDGDTDVLSASGGDDKIAWYKNDGAGNFGSQQVITTSADLALCVYAADLDKDGDVDVLSASVRDGKIAWYKNDGAGNFGPQQVITTALNGPTSVYAADLDKDGDIDVLSASLDDNKIAWYKNDGAGNFGPQQVITTSANRAESVYAADLDNDGDMDVLSASSADDKIAWYKNDGAGSFGPQQVITTAADNALSVYVADLDKDGDMDVLSASYLDNKIAWYENDGAGNFGPQQVITTAANGAESVYAADLDKDGDMDVLSASLGDNKIAWYENDGAGNFGPQQVITTAVNGAESVYAADLDRDGDMDVLSASAYDDKIAWYENVPNQEPVLNDQTLGPLAENSANGTVVGTVAATDPDAGQTLTYAITAGNTGDAFAIDAATGQVTVANDAMLNFETTPTFALTVQATDNEVPALSDTGTVTINLTNVNEAPSDIVLSSNTVPENLPVDTVVAAIGTIDPDAEDLFTYSLVSGTGGDDNGQFTISGNRLLTAASFDYEAKADYAVRIRSTDQGGLWTEKPFTINVTDASDAPALTGVEGAALSYTENAAATAITGTLVASDIDSENLSGATVQITSNYQNGQDVLSFADTANITGVWAAATGTLILSGTDTVSNYQAALRAATYQNTSESPSTATRTVTFKVNDGLLNSNTVTRDITVTAVNDAPADVLLAGSSVAENSLNGTVVGTVSATGDLDAANTYTYSLTDNAGGRFAIHPTTGVITVLDGTKLDYETATSHNVTVHVVDSTPGTPDLALDRVFAIAVTDVNEAPAVSAFSKKYAAKSPATFTAADFAGTFADPDAGDALQRVRITALPAHGTLTLGKVVVTLNREIPAAQLGTLTYKPASKYVGPDSFRWNGLESDGSQWAAADAPVNLSFDAHAPTVAAFSKAVAHDTVLTFAPLDFTSHFTDLDAGDTLQKVKITKAPKGGVLRLNGALLTKNQEILVSQLGNLTFTPNAGYTGTAVFSWTASDGVLYAARAALVTLTVN